MIEMYITESHNNYSLILISYKLYVVNNIITQINELILKWNETKMSLINLVTKPYYKFKVSSKISILSVNRQKILAKSPIILG